MLCFRDFVPPQTSPPGFLTWADYDSVHSAVGAANAWLLERGIKPINVETVLLPNIHSRHEQGPADSHLRTGDSLAEWHQVVRVWYQEA